MGSEMRRNAIHLTRKAWQSRSNPRTKELDEVIVEELPHEITTLSPS